MGNYLHAFSADTVQAALSKDEQTKEAGAQAIVASA
jgi:hypothetical protein